MRKSALFSDLGTKALTEKKKEGLVTAIYIGSIFILLALIYLVNVSKGLFGNLESLFSSFTFTTVPGTSITLPAPSNPAAFTLVYNAAFEFAFGLGMIELIILSLRIAVHSPLSRKAETIENLVFWLGTSFLVISYLVNMTIISEWFVFWSGIILIAGLALVTRGFVLFVRR
jgi:hypothetical protein